MAYHSWTSKPPTKEYQDAHPGEFTKWAEKYCGTCGRLPAFCECKVIAEDTGEIRCSTCLGQPGGFVNGARITVKAATYGEMERKAVAKGWSATSDGVAWLCPKHKEKRG